MSAERCTQIKLILSITFSHSTQFVVSCCDSSSLKTNLDNPLSICCELRCLFSAGLCLMAKTATTEMVYNFWHKANVITCTFFNIQAWIQKINPHGYIHCLSQPPSTRYTQTPTKKRINWSQWQRAAWNKRPPPPGCQNQYWHVWQRRTVSKGKLLDWIRYWKWQMTSEPLSEADRQANDQRPPWQMLSSTSRKERTLGNKMTAPTTTLILLKNKGLASEKRKLSTLALHLENKEPCYLNFFLFSFHLIL